MELPNLGKQCSLDSCKQLDFLPFTCDACKKIYCKDHVKYDQHQCQFAQNKDRRVPICPLCNQPISLSSSESVDHKVNEHIENDCKSDLAKHKRSKKCKVKGCKQRELIPVLCSSCKQNLCLRHRHENDHDCVAKTNSPSHRNPQSSESARAGQAAASRFNLNKPAESNRLANAKPQEMSLSSVGADFNRLRNERQQSARVASARVLSTGTSQLNNSSEDQALALALQASLAEVSFTPAAQDPYTPKKELSQQEQEDLALARALAESEKDERNRQRNSNAKPSQKNKDSCAVS